MIGVGKYILEGANDAFFYLIDPAIFLNIPEYLRGVTITNGGAYPLKPLPS